MWHLEQYTYFLYSVFFFNLSFRFSTFSSSPLSSCSFFSLFQFLFSHFFLLFLSFVSALISKFSRFYSIFYATWHHLFQTTYSIASLKFHYSPWILSKSGLLRRRCQLKLETMASPLNDKTDLLANIGDTRGSPPLALSQVLI